MFRNQYDNDITTFSPQGRLHQVEYALEAVKQGSACVGICSASHVVIAAIQRRLGGDLAGYQNKILKLDDHIGVCFSGLTSDARVLSNFIRAECLHNRLMLNAPLSAFRAAHLVADKAQINTQMYGARPYGVGLLLAACDATGPHLYDISPAGTATDYCAHAIGARSQSARTYLESNMPYSSCSRDDLVRHALMALKNTLHTDKRVDAAAVVVAVATRGSSSSSSSSGEAAAAAASQEPRFELLSEAEIRPFFDATLATAVGENDDDNNNNNNDADAADAAAPPPPPPPQAAAETDETGPAEMDTSGI